MTWKVLINTHYMGFLQKRIGTYMCVSENSVPHFPNGFADHYPY